MVSELCSFQLIFLINTTYKSVYEPLNPDLESKPRSSSLWTAEANLCHPQETTRARAKTSVASRKPPMYTPLWVVNLVDLGFPAATPVASRPLVTWSAEEQSVEG